MSEKYKVNGVDTLIGRTGTGITNGYKQAGISIRPYQTYYDFANSTFTNYLGGTGSTYAGILLPSKSSTNYWVASRCVETRGFYCSFAVRRVSRGDLNICNMCNSYDSVDGSAYQLFPVVSLSSTLIGPKSGGGYEVK